MPTAVSDQISVETTGHVAVVTFDRGPMNHASAEFIRDLADLMQRMDGDPQVRAVVLQSQGKVFCAGADLNRPEEAAAEGHDTVMSLYIEAIRLFRSDTPMVAAIQGAAVGAGLGLALVADFRVAAPEARFAANFVKLGFHPGFGLTHTLPRAIGEQRAALMFLTGRRVKAEDALGWGLVDELVPAEALRGAALRLAQEIAENAPLAVASTRRTLRAGLAEAVRASTLHEHFEQTSLRQTADYAEGVRAVAERRAGNFQGR
jgi:enoyl-CoA hydratase/carnithine racemase